MLISFPMNMPRQRGMGIVAKTGTKSTANGQNSKFVSIAVHRWFKSLLRVLRVSVFHPSSVPRKLAFVSAISDLLSLLPADRVLTDPSELFVYEFDGFTIARPRPPAVVFPTTT